MNRSYPISQNQFLRVLEQRASEYRLAGPPKENGYYRLISGWLGIAPWKLIVPLSVISGFGIVALFKSRAVELVSILQWGF